MYVIAYLKRAGLDGVIMRLVRVSYGVTIRVVDEDGKEIPGEWSYFPYLIPTQKRREK